MQICALMAIYPSLPKNEKQIRKSLRCVFWLPRIFFTNSLLIFDEIFSIDLNCSILLGFYIHVLISNFSLETLFLIPEN